MSTDILLEVLKEEQSQGDNYSEGGTGHKSCDDSNPSLRTARLECLCHTKVPIDQKLPNDTNIEELLMKKEIQLKAHYEQLMKEEIANLNAKMDFVLQNEQIRSAYMMTEAHRDRQEKIAALQRQLQNKNLSGLMYVLCTERRRSRLEKLRIISEFSDYIKQLKTILKEGQAVIKDLARGYKSAARVDHEWREKMHRILKEFKIFIHHYAGGTPEQNEHLLDTPALLATAAPLVNPDEYLDSDAEAEQEPECLDEPTPTLPWWQQVARPGPAPFVMYGDMSEFRAPQRREVLRVVKGAKNAPKNWREYVFDDMRVRHECSNVALVGAEAARRPEPWSQLRPRASASVNSPKSETTGRSYTMGSMLKIFAASNIANCEPVTKAVLLGARDSTEIASSTKILNKLKPAPENVNALEGSAKAAAPDKQATQQDPAQEESDHNSETDKRAVDDISAVDSLTLQPKLMSDHSNRIVYEKYCPVELCKRLQVDSFVRSLPAYMRQGPYAHFEHYFEEYEVCSPEQIEALKQRIAAKRASLKAAAAADADPLAEWGLRPPGVATQTEPELEPCTCRDRPSGAPSYAEVIDLKELLESKQLIDHVTREHLFSDRVQFDRCSVVGRDEKAPGHDLNLHASLDVDPETFRQSRLTELTAILRRHPSLVDMLQSNAE